MSAAEVAREAAQIITERGLAKGTPRDSQGRVCFMGAAVAAERELDCYGFVDAIAKTAARHVVPLGVACVVSFNDLPETTAEDVAKLLLQLADDLDVTP